MKTNIDNIEVSYSLKFEMPYITCDNFKEKEITIINNFISGARIRKIIKYGGLASIEFDEFDKHKHEFPKVKLLPSFVKQHTNGVIYDILVPCKYDKILIYQNILKNTNFYGFVIFNSNDPSQQFHYYNIEYDLTTFVKDVDRLIENKDNTEE